MTPHASSSIGRLAVAAPPLVRTDVPSTSDPRGWPRARALALDGLTVIAVGLAVPLGILTVGIPIVAVLRLAAALVD